MPVDSRRDGSMAKHAAQTINNAAAATSLCGSIWR